jgi:hypothetical protein
VQVYEELERLVNGDVMQHFMVEYKLQHNVRTTVGDSGKKEDTAVTGIVSKVLTMPGVTTLERLRRVPTALRDFFDRQAGISLADYSGRLDEDSKWKDRATAALKKAFEGLGTVGAGMWDLILYEYKLEQYGASADAGAAMPNRAKTNWLSSAVQGKGVTRFCKI